MIVYIFIMIVTSSDLLFSKSDYSDELVGFHFSFCDRNVSGIRLYAILPLVH